MKLSFVSRLMAFNPTELLSQTLRFRKLLKNEDVVDMLRVAHLYGELRKESEFIDPGHAPDYTFEKLLEELQNS